MTVLLAMVFPGQGSQSVGMLADVAEKFSEVKETFAEASAVLGYDLWSLTINGPAESLDQTVHTQPALLAASYALWRIIQSHTVLKPAMLAGHSLGEYSALVCANALDFKQAVKIVAARGQYMQEAVPAGTGAMAAIVGLDNETVAELCRQARTDAEILSPANFNSIGQVVIAGHHSAVEKALVIAKEKGAKLAINIPVSVPSHCALMHPAADKLAALINTIEFKIPSIPVINNADVKSYSNADDIRAGLVKQLYSPVRWVETIQTFVASGVQQIIECGPGKVLTGLNKRIDKNLQLQSIGDLTNLELLLQTDRERSA